MTKDIDSSIRAAGPTGRHLACNQEIGVRLPGGPLSVFISGVALNEIGKVAGYGWPGRTANAVSQLWNEGSNPLPSARMP